MVKLQGIGSDKGFKAVILPDVHIDDKGVHKVYNPVKDFIKDFKPDLIILLGDFADGCALSNWDLSKKRKMEGRRHKNEIDNVNKELDFLQKYCKKIVWLEGNHEDRVERYLDTHSEVEELIEYQHLCKLEERGIEWIPFNKLYQLGDLYMVHGRYTNQHHAKKHLERIGGNICYGHTHLPQVFGTNRELQKPYKSVGLGCLCDKKPEYLKGKEGNWINGFAILYMSTRGHFNLYPIDIIKGHFYTHGKNYC
jgi:predicted MPP superfamily phosphohydrolase